MIVVVWCKPLKVRHLHYWKVRWKHTTLTHLRICIWEAYASSAIRAKKRGELQSSLQARTRSLFNKQILLLQNAALQRFKSTVLDNVTDPGYETETSVALRRVDDWFARNAEALLVPSMRLSFRSFRQEAHNALHTHGDGASNSPTAKLQAMQHMG